MRILHLAAVWVAPLYLLLVVQSALGERSFQPERELVVKFSEVVAENWTGR